MAREILVLDFDSLIFMKRYAVAPIVILGEAQLLSSPSSALTPLAAGQMSVSDIADIDGGKISWQITVIEKSSGESIADYEARVESKWSLWSESEGNRITKWADQISNVRWVDVT